MFWAFVSFSTQAEVVNTPDITNQTLDSNLLDVTSESLYESTAVDPTFLNTDYDPYLTLSEDANVSVSFIDEGAGYKNSLGWFTFDETTFDGLSKGDIDTNSDGIVSFTELNSLDGVDSGWLFANISEQGGGGDLLTGDTVTIGDGPLSAGTSVSFFLAQNAFTGGSSVDDGIYTGDTQIFYGLDFLNPEADFTHNIESNIQNARHVAMLFSDDEQENVIMGFEDLNRTDSSLNHWGISSDEDFNDAVFTISSDPVSALSTSNIATAPLPDIGQGPVGILLLFGLSTLAVFSRGTILIT
ncbi:DUF4114 domain-containing protein [Parasalinivibrio latis]|uniref:DUF4114 domain-containing protein n=1 Tax=Parasalinivibrio latis TaxID=2952610 RepID=UPI0030E54083